MRTAGLGNPRPGTNLAEVYGVDFSGANDAGKKTWIAEGVGHGSDLRIDRVGPAASWFGMGSERSRCLAALVGFIAGKKDAVFGLDFPFGLPQEVATKILRARKWEDLALQLGRRYQSHHHLQAACLQAAGCRELRRRTDEESGAPFSPYNRRICAQTYFGIVELLAPLARSKAACVLPMQECHVAKPRILEICPASTLKWLWSHRKLEGLENDRSYLSYKGNRKERSERERRLQRRRLILAALENVGSVSFADADVRSSVVNDPEGDALDGVIAALTTFRVARENQHRDVKTEELLPLEGRIFYRWKDD